MLRVLELSRPFKTVIVFALLCAAVVIMPDLSASSNYFEYDQSDRDMKVVGRVYRLGEDVLVEAWATPRRMRPKIDHLELISPSGQRYKISSIENFPMSQLASKRAQYTSGKRSAISSGADWLVGTAEANCRPGHGDSDGGGASSTEDNRSAESMAGFGALAGLAASQEKEWVSSGKVSGVKDEPGTWKLGIQITDGKNARHSFTVPFELSALSVGPGVSMPAPPAKNERETTMLESVDANGVTTRVTLNRDGSRTILVTAPDGRVISRQTRQPAAGATRTWLDPETGLRISEWKNPDGSVTRRAEDEHGNWSEGTRFPGGKKDPPASTPDSESPPPAPPQPPAPPTPEPSSNPPDDGLPPPRSGGGTVSIPVDEKTVLDDIDPTVYGEDLSHGKVGVLLLREDDEWVPNFGNNTNVYAKIYEPDPNRPGVWLPSPTQKRVITVRFVERSNEPGRCLNRDLPNEPQDTPDLFMREENNLGTICTDDPTGTGAYAGSCTTKREENIFTFMVRSEDFGGFSKMEATCDGCTPLVPVFMGRSERFPQAVEAKEREQTLVRVPKDTNDNQISDGYAPDRGEFFRADEDSENDPVGNGVKGDGLSAYEEYRGFYNKYMSHNRLDWKKKNLFIVNVMGLPGVDRFEQVSGLGVVRIDPDQHRDRVVNFNHHHAHSVDQHSLVLVELSEPGNGLLGYTDTVDFGPPKNCERVEIFPDNHRDPAAVPETVVHELGHATGMRHHGDTATWWEEWYPPGTWRDYNPLAGLSIAGYQVMANTHTGPELCGRVLPKNILFGEKHNQSSGAVDCYMRYEYHGRVFRQEDGSMDCIEEHPGFTGFCNAPAGTGFNAGNAVAGNATVGNCKAQQVINDLAAA